MADFMIAWIIGLILNGTTAEEYLEKARVLFEEMDLKWDLELLEKVKDQAVW